MRDAYIVTSIRTPGCKRSKGAFKDTRPEDLLTFMLEQAVERTPNLEKAAVEDLMIGCAFPEAEQGLNIALWPKWPDSPTRSPARPSTASARRAWRPLPWRRYA